MLDRTKKYLAMRRRKERTEPVSAKLEHNWNETERNEWQSKAKEFS